MELNMSDAENNGEQSLFKKNDMEMKRFRRSHPAISWNNARNERVHCTGEADNDCLHHYAETAGSLRHIEHRAQPAQHRYQVSLMKLLDLIPICGELELHYNQQN